MFINSNLDQRPLVCSVYCRVSSEEQQERETIENQIEFAAKYCDLLGYEILDWYKDDGISGTIPFEERPGGKRLMNDIRMGKKPDFVLIYNVKRLGRMARITLNSVYELEQLGVAIRSMTEPFDTGNPAGRFMLTVLAGEADFDRDTLLSNMWMGANRKAAQGYWLGGIVPYGYLVVNGFLEVNEEKIPGFEFSEADIIRLIYYQVAELHLSCVKVADYLNMLHIPTSYVRAGRAILRGKRKVATSGRWTPARIRNIIVNSTYKGIHIYGKRSKKKRELIERNVPWIIVDDQWNRAQDVLRENQLESMRNSKHQYLLRGLIKCGQCGLTYSGVCFNSQGKDSKKIPYYRCGGKQIYRGPLEGRCKSKNIPREWIEKIVWNDCVNFILNPGDAIRELMENIEESKNKREPIEEERQTLIQTIKDKDIEKQRILDLYRSKIIGFKDVESQLQKISEEKEWINQRVSELDKLIEAEESAALQVTTVEELLSQFRDVVQGDINFEDKRKIVRCLVQGIKVDTNFDSPDLPQAIITIFYRFHKDVPSTSFMFHNGIIHTGARVDFMAIPLGLVTALRRIFNVIKDEFQDRY